MKFRKYLFIIIGLLILFSSFVIAIDFSTGSISYFSFTDGKLSDDWGNDSNGCTIVGTLTNTTTDCASGNCYDYKERNTDEVNGVLIGTKEHKNNNGIYINEKEGNIEQCSVPVGDRNWKEFPLKQYEIDKGFCWKTKIIVTELSR